MTRVPHIDSPASFRADRSVDTFGRCSLAECSKTKGSDERLPLLVRCTRYLVMHQLYLVTPRPCPSVSPPLYTSCTLMRLTLLVHLRHIPLSEATLGDVLLVGLLYPNGAFRLSNQVSNSKCELNFVPSRSLGSASPRLTDTEAFCCAVGDQSDNERKVDAKKKASHGGAVVAQTDGLAPISSCLLPQ